MEGKCFPCFSDLRLFRRTAGCDGKIYVDLCNDLWEVVEISSQGWEVVNNSPVKFVRHPGMLPLPRPTNDGDINELREFINVTDQDWVFAVAWLMGALRPFGPYPILLVNGEQGSCKTTTCRRLRSLIDPNSVPLRDTPKDERALMISASNAHVIALDNISSVPKWLSNAMCRLSSGGGHSQRALYSDDTEKLFYAIRPQMLNGIGEIADRGDLLDRSLALCLPTIAKSHRRTEKELDEAFEKVYPSILGAMFTAAATGLQRLPEIDKLRFDLPRLADFCKWMIAVETALGWEEGTIIAAMNKNAGDAHELVLSSSPVGDAVRKFAKKHHKWEGTCTNLIKMISNDSSERADSWPANGQKLSTKLRELAPALRGVGIDVKFHDGARPKKVVLEDKSGKPQTEETCFDNGVETTCFANGSEDDFAATELVGRLLKIWFTPTLSVPPVAPATELPAACDGMQVLSL